MKYLGVRHTLPPPAHRSRGEFPQLTRARRHDNTSQHLKRPLSKGQSALSSARNRSRADHTTAVTLPVLVFLGVSGRLSLAILGCDLDS